MPTAPRAAKPATGAPEGSGIGDETERILEAVATAPSRANGVHEYGSGRDVNAGQRNGREDREAPRKITSGLAARDEQCSAGAFAGGADDAGDEETQSAETATGGTPGAPQPLSAPTRADSGAPQSSSDDSNSVGETRADSGAPQSSSNDSNSVGETTSVTLSSKASAASKSPSRRLGGPASATVAGRLHGESTNVEARSTPESSEMLTGGDAGPA